MICDNDRVFYLTVICPLAGLVGQYRWWCTKWALSCLRTLITPRPRISHFRSAVSQRGSPFFRWLLHHGERGKSLFATVLAWVTCINCVPNGESGSFMIVIMFDLSSVSSVRFKVKGSRVAKKSLVKGEMPTRSLASVLTSIVLSLVYFPRQRFHYLRRLIRAKQTM